MNKDSCIICGIEAVCIAKSADYYDFRCEKCGKYYFLDGIHETDYKKLDEKEREKISKYIKKYNETTGAWAEVGDITELWEKIEYFNRNKREE